jgi:antitoxin HicB
VYSIVLTPDPDAGGYVVTCPALPGVVTEAETPEEARRMAKEAIEGYLATLIAQGEPVPPGDDEGSRPILDSVLVDLAA